MCHCAISCIFVLDRGIEVRVWLSELRLEGLRLEFSSGTIFAARDWYLRRGARLVLDTFIPAIHFSRNFERRVQFTFDWEQPLVDREYCMPCTATLGVAALWLKHSELFRDG